MPTGALANLLLGYPGQTHWLPLKLLKFHLGCVLPRNLIKYYKT